MTMFYYIVTELNHDYTANYVSLLSATIIAVLYQNAKERLSAMLAGSFPRKHATALTLTVLQKAGMQLSPPDVQVCPL